MKFFILTLLGIFASSVALPTGLAEDGQVLDGCGGVVRLGVDSRSYISFKENVTLRPEERCIWSLLPEDPLVAFDTITLRIESFGFGSSDSTTGLIFYSWSERGFFEGSRIYTLGVGKEYTFTTSQGFLSFSTDWFDITTTGFTLSFTGSPSSTPSKIENREVLYLPGLGVTSCGAGNEDGMGVGRGQVTVTYPEFPAVAYKDSTKLAVVIPQMARYDTRGSLLINYLDTELGLDILEIIRIQPFDEHDSTHWNLGTFSGNHTQGIDEIASYGSVIILFSSDGTNAGRGFQLHYENGRT